MGEANARNDNNRNNLSRAGGKLALIKTTVIDNKVIFGRD